jgi:DnaJ-class molecular chaperone
MDDVMQNPTTGLITGPTDVPTTAGGDGQHTGANVCPTCGGAGRTDDASCPTCKGAGLVEEPVGDA